MPPFSRRAPSLARCAVVLSRIAMLAIPLAAFAGETDAPTTSVPASVAALPVDAAPCHCAPVGTPIAIEIDDSLVSDERQRGDVFALHLAEPIVVDGVVLVPAGTRGQGEIVHAAKARGGGQPGELTLAARYLDVGGRHVALRGMKFGLAGTDHSSAALATAIAVGVFAEFIHGGEVRIAPGTHATAKLAVAVDAVSPAPDAAAAPLDTNATHATSEPTTKPTQE